MDKTLNMTPQLGSSLKSLNTLSPTRFLQALFSILTFHQLLLADANIHHFGRWRLIQTDFGEKLFRALVGFMPIDYTMVATFVAKKDVFGNG